MTLHYDDLMRILLAACLILGTAGCEDEAAGWCENSAVEGSGLAVDLSVELREGCPCAVESDTYCCLEPDSHMLACQEGVWTAASDGSVCSEFLVDSGSDVLPATGLVGVCGYLDE